MFASSESSRSRPLCAATHFRTKYRTCGFWSSGWGNSDQGWSEDMLATRREVMKDVEHNFEKKRLYTEKRIEDFNGHGLRDGVIYRHQINLTYTWFLLSTYFDDSLTSTSKLVLQLPIVFVLNLFIIFSPATSCPENFASRLSLVQASEG